MDHVLDPLQDETGSLNKPEINQRWIILAINHQLNVNPIEMLF